MTLLRERRNKKALKLHSLPPPFPAAGFHRRALSTSPSSSSSSSSASSISPSIDSLSDLEKLMILSHGNGGTVYKVRHRQTLVLYALKVVRFGKEQAAACVEADILKQVDSQFIVKCHRVFDSHVNRSAGDTTKDEGDRVCFVMELMEVGSLHDILLARRRLPEMAISVVARHVLQGLRYLHNIGIVHRDIKPSNLLINDKGEIKIADFGVSCRLNDTLAEERTGSYMGTCAYMSPERFDQERYNHSGGVDSWCTKGFAGDVWSLGVVVLECHVGHFPLISQGEKPDWATLMCAVCFGEKKTVIPENASPEFRSFVWRCLEKDWRLRATVEELLSHPSVTKYYTCSGAAQELVGCG